MGVILKAFRVQDNSLKMRIHLELAHVHKGLTLNINFKQTELISLQLKLIFKEQSILQIDRWNITECTDVGFSISSQAGSSQAEIAAELGSTLPL